MRRTTRNNNRSRKLSLQLGNKTFNNGGEGRVRRGEKGRENMSDEESDTSDENSCILDVVQNQKRQKTEESKSIKNCLCISIYTHVL